ncbi:NIPSNAP family containing protein, partial [Litorilinea aerophila]
MFFELRQYRTKPGQRERWVRFMEEVIIPYQVSKGMVVVGSFVGQEEEDLYVWIRRFDSEEERERLYKAVYETDYWQNEISPQVGEMLD